MWSDRVAKVLSSVHICSLHKLYTMKWKRFQCWISEKCLSPELCHLHVAFEYQLTLMDDGLLVLSIKVHLAAISAYHDAVDGCALLSCKLSKMFLEVI